MTEQFDIVITGGRVIDPAHEGHPGRRVGQEVAAVVDRVRLDPHDDTALVRAVTERSEELARDLLDSVFGKRTYPTVLG